MEIVQIVLLAAVGLLTIILGLAGVQVIRILAEFKKTVEKVNKILEDMGKVSSSVSKIDCSFSGVFSSLKAGLHLLKLLTDHKKEKKENE